MTHQARPQPIPIPISALLPPSRESGPSKPLPFPSAAVQGPLPPTSAIHLALNWLAVSDLPEYTAVDAEQSFSKHLATALIITGSKAGFADSIEEDDEDWLRYHAGDYGVLYRLKRVDIRQVIPLSSWALL